MHITSPRNLTLTRTLGFSRVCDKNKKHKKNPLLLSVYGYCGCKSWVVPPCVWQSRLDCRSGADILSVNFFQRSEGSLSWDLHCCSGFLCLCSQRSTFPLISAGFVCSTSSDRPWAGCAELNWKFFRNDFTVCFESSSSSTKTWWCQHRWWICTWRSLDQTGSSLWWTWRIDQSWSSVVSSAAVLPPHGAFFFGCRLGDFL